MHRDELYYLVETYSKLKVKYIRNLLVRLLGRIFTPHITQKQQLTSWYSSFIKSEMAVSSNRCVRSLPNCFDTNEMMLASAARTNGEELRERPGNGIDKLKGET